MEDKVEFSMEYNQQKELRYAMETQFRYKFYKSPEFPFLPSLGIRHIFQGFEAKEETIKPLVAKVFREMLG